MKDELVALLAGVEAGRVTSTRGQVTFIYNDEWREAPNSYPLSLSLPLSVKEHGPAARGREFSAIESFLWGLLPDNELVLDKWAKKFHVSARNVFALLAHVGEDCAGAVQFVPPERVDDIRSGEQDKIEWLGEHELAERLRALREDHTAWRLPGDTGQFSLAGAQPKTAMLYMDGRWGIPSGRTATTHIIKPPTGQFDGHAENEHFCLALARALGLPAAQSQVMRFENEVAIVIERYDRQLQGNDILRVHQEDVCQALGVPPSQKYQNERGPGVSDIVELLRTHSSDSGTDVDTFIRAVGLNWLIGGTDAHAKNYSLLTSGPRVRLAPLYDVASILPYDFDLKKAKFAMKIGGEYGFDQIGKRQWEKCAVELKIDPARLIPDLREMAISLPDALTAEHKQARKEGLEHGIIDRLAERITKRSQECAALL
jgi:serine/threonine-protein kinase HipA